MAAEKFFLERSHEADEYMRNIRDRNVLPEAVEDCIEAAGALQSSGKLLTLETNRVGLMEHSNFRAPKRPHASCPVWEVIFNTWWAWYWPWVCRCILNNVQDPESFKRNEAVQSRFAFDNYTVQVLQTIYQEIAPSSLKKIEKFEHPGVLHLESSLIGYSLVGFIRCQ